MFAAGDNTQVLSYTHTSRINQAVFMATVQSEENVNILGVIYENMVFELLSMDGVKVIVNILSELHYFNMSHMDCSCDPWTYLVWVED